MTARRFVLALDQGTTGSTALVVDPDGAVRARGYAELPQHYPQPGWVEHDPAQIWSTTVQALGQAIVGPEVPKQARLAGLTLGVWTVNERDAIERFLTLGAGVVITDRPDLAKELLGR